MNVRLPPLTRAHFPLLVQRLAKPHVFTWWKESLDLAGVERRYGRRIDGAEPTSLFLIEVGGAPIGMLQSYWVDDQRNSGHAASEGLPGGVGVDLFLGEEACIGRGYGPAALLTFVTQIAPARYPGAPGVVADPSPENHASIRAFEKAGFRRGQVVDGVWGFEQLMLFEFERDSQRFDSG